MEGVVVKMLRVERLDEGQAQTWQAAKLKGQALQGLWKLNRSNLNFAAVTLEVIAEKVVEGEERAWEWEG